MTRDEILHAAKVLRPNERLALARDIALSAERDGAELSEAEWDSAWGEEAERRFLEIEAGRLKEIPGEVVEARARALVQPRR